MDYTKFNGNSFAGSNSEVHFDSGLRAYMIAVFKDMAIGLAITGLIAMLVASSPAMMQTIYGTPLSWVVMFAPLVLVFYMYAKFASMETSAVRNLFYIYSATMGLSMAFIFMVYTGESIARTFFVTASTFGAMSIYGYSTKKDLTSMGSFLMMGVIGIVIASLVNIFMQSSGLSFAISILSVIIFTGLTAYDTQRIKDLYYQAGSQDVADKMGVYGALMLYMDFINIFMSLLRLFGDRRSE